MKITIIGCGNLGESFLTGLIRSKTFNPAEITASDLDEEKLEKIRELEVKTTTDNKKAVEGSKVVFVAVKPSIVGKVIENLELTEDKLLISLAAGVSTDFLGKHTNARVVRVMPNICGRVAEMASGYTLGKNATEEDEKLVNEILSKMGETLKVNEDLMDIITGLSGSGPAYIFLVIKAMKDAGVENGLSESESTRLAAQTVKGSSELVLESKENLEDLIDMVCSPKGTTIEGVKVLEDGKVEENIKKAVKAAKKRSKELSK